MTAKQINKFTPHNPLALENQYQSVGSSQLEINTKMIIIDKSFQPEKIEESEHHFDELFEMDKKHVINQSERELVKDGKWEVISNKK